MEDTRYKNALSHALVAGTTLWCLYHTGRSETWKWVYLSYGTLFIHSLLGVWRFGNPRYGNKSIRVYDLTEQCATATILPCIVADLYIYYGFSIEYAVLHVAIPIMLALISQILGSVLDEEGQELVDAAILGNAASLAFICVKYVNPYGVAAALNYIFLHLVFNNHEFYDIPKVVLHNVGICFFLFFSFRALTEAHVKAH